MPAGEMKESSNARGARGDDVLCEEPVDALPLEKGRMPDAVIFDLDGTLVDSVDDVAAVLNTLLAAERISPFPRETVAGFMGEGIRATVGKALAARGVEAGAERLDRLHARFVDLYCLHPVSATRLFPYAGSLLAGLAARGVKIGICTNKAEAPARLILEQVGIARYVEAVIASDSGYGMKPAPTPLLACARQLGARRERVVYVGDHPIDVETARAAGIAMVGVSYGYAVGDLEAEQVVDCLSGLPTILARLASA